MVSISPPNKLPYYLEVCWQWVQSPDSLCFFTYLTCRFKEINLVKAAGQRADWVIASFTSWRKQSHPCVAICHWLENFQHWRHGCLLFEPSTAFFCPKTETLGGQKTLQLWYFLFEFPPICLKLTVIWSHVRHDSPQWMFYSLVFILKLIMVKTMWLFFTINE